MKLLSKLKRSAAIVCRSFDEKYVACLSDRKVFLLETETDRIVFDQKIRIGTSMCFSDDNQKFFLFSYLDLEVKVFCVGTWEQENTIGLEMIRKSYDKNNLGGIYPLEDGFCVTYALKTKKSKQDFLPWNLLLYNVKDCTFIIKEDEGAPSIFDIYTKSAVFEYEKCLFMGNKGEIKEEIFDKEEVFRAGDINFDASYMYCITCTANLEKFFLKRKNRVTKKDEIIRVFLRDVDGYPNGGPLEVTEQGIFLFYGEGHKLICVNFEGEIVDQQEFRYTFSFVAANGKVYVADWDHLAILEVE